MRKTWISGIVQEGPGVGALPSFEKYIGLPFTESPESTSGSFSVAIQTTGDPL